MRKNRFIRYVTTPAEPEGGTPVPPVPPTPDTPAPPVTPPTPAPPATPVAPDLDADVPEGSYPANTSVAEMTIEQQRNFYKHHTYLERKNTKNVEKARIAAAAEASRAAMTDQQRLLTDAEAKGRAAATQEFQGELVLAKIEAIGIGLSAGQMSQLKSAVNVQAFVGQDGKPDEERIRKLLEPFQGGATIARRQSPGSGSASHGTSIAEEMARLTKAQKS